VHFAFVVESCMQVKNSILLVFVGFLLLGFEICKAITIAKGKNNCYHGKENLSRRIN